MIPIKTTTKCCKSNVQHDALKPFFVNVIAKFLLKHGVSDALLVCQNIVWCNSLFSQTRHDTNYTGGKSIPTKHSAGTNNKMIKATGRFARDKQHSLFVL